MQSKKRSHHELKNLTVEPFQLNQSGFAFFPGVLEVQNSSRASADAK